MARDLMEWAGDLEQWLDGQSTLRRSDLPTRALAAVLRAVAANRPDPRCDCDYCDTARAVLAALAPLAPLFPEADDGS